MPPALSSLEFSEPYSVAFCALRVPAGTPTPVATAFSECEIETDFYAIATRIDLIQINRQKATGG